MGEEEETASDIEQTEMKNVDRISSLSDDLIITILSYLTAKEISQTCILSKRWRKLWACVPSLCFDIHDSNKEIEFVGNFLLKRDGATDTDVFRILCSNSYDNTDVDVEELSKCIIYAVKHNVRTLELAFPIYDSVPDIPNCLFTCKTLEELKIYLQSAHEAIRPRTVHLPRLRNLYLNHAELYEEIVEIILSGCPVLENYDVHGYDISMSRFSSRDAKQLTIDINYIGSEISVSSLSAETLNLSTHMGNVVTLGDLPKVTQATVSIPSHIRADETYNCNLLGGLSNVEKLDIASRCSQELLLVGCPTFHRLKFLFIHNLSTCSAFEAWSFFIKHCPNLEELYLDPGHAFWPGKQTHRYLKQIEGFTCKRLKKVCIFYTDTSRLSLCELVVLVKHCTKEIKGVEITLVRNEPKCPPERIVIRG